MLVYLHHKCSTCKKAIDFLNENAISFSVKDITKEAPSMKELKKMLSIKKDIKKLLNTSGILYREMELSKKIPQMKEDEVLKLLSENGMLVKRPFVLTDDKGLLGFKEAEWEEVFTNS